MFSFLKRNDTQISPSTQENSASRQKEKLVDHMTDIGKASEDPYEFMRRFTELEAEGNRGKRDASADPDYGLVPTKPIFVEGFGRNREYLDHLYSPNGEKIQYTRICALEVEGISGMVDCYSISLPGKPDYMHLFLSVYGTTTSTKAPRGLLYR